MKCLHLYLGGGDHISYFYPIKSYKEDTDPECQKLSTGSGTNRPFLAIVNYPPRGAHEVQGYTPNPEDYRDKARNIISCLKEWKETFCEISKLMRSAPADWGETSRLHAMRRFFEGFSKLLDSRYSFEHTRNTGMYWRLVRAGCDLLNDPRLIPDDIDGEYEEVMFNHCKTQVCKEHEDKLKVYIEFATRDMEKFVAMLAPCKDIVVCDPSEAPTYTSNKYYYTAEV